MYYFVVTTFYPWARAAEINPLRVFFTGGGGGSGSDLRDATDKSVLHHVDDLNSVRGSNFIGLMGWNSVTWLSDYDTQCVIRLLSVQKSCFCTAHGSSVHYSSLLFLSWPIICEQYGRLTQIMGHYLNPTKQF